MPKNQPSRHTAATIAMTVAVNVCRFVLGLTLVFSGFVKAIDPLGTQYKMQDYLTAMGIGQWVPDIVTLAAAVCLAALEFAIGVYMLFAIRRRQGSKVALVFMALMTLLTVWIAIANPVSDCGCFGDAIHLSNTQTLLKNIILLACAAVVARKPLLMYRFLSRSTQWIAINYTILFIVGISLWCLYYLPLFDFRPYHIGANIREGMEIPEDAEMPEFKTTFLMEKNGERREFTVDNYPDSTWTFIDSKTVEIKAGYVPPIHDFSIQLADGDDITDSILSRRGYTFLLIASRLDRADDSCFGDIDQIYEYAQSQDIPFLCLTASNEKAISHWEEITGAEYTFCQTDGTTLKTIIRSNPGLLLLKDGTVIGKWSHNNLPTGDALKQPISRSPIGQMPPDKVGSTMTKVALWFFLPLVLLVFADRTWKRLRSKKTKDNKQ